MTQTDAKVRNSKRAVDEAQAWRHGPRRYFPIEQKLAIVAECSVAGATLGERDASPREVRVEIETPRGVMRVNGCVDEPILSALIFAMTRG